MRSKLTQIKSDNLGNRRASQKRSCIMSAKNMDINLLSNAELLAMLRERGATCGPIIAQTRRVYLKKLERLLKTESGSHDSDDENSILDDQDDDDEQNIGGVDKRWPNPSAGSSEPVGSLRFRPAVPVPNRPVSPDYQLPSAVSSQQQQQQSGIPRSYQSLEHRRDVPSTQAGPLQPPAALPVRRIPLLLKLSLLAAVMLLVYLIVQNMEPAYRPPGLRSADD